MESLVSWIADRYHYSMSEAEVYATDCIQQTASKMEMKVEDIQAMIDDSTFIDILISHFTEEPISDDQDTDEIGGLHPEILSPDDQTLANNLLFIINQFQNQTHLPLYHHGQLSDELTYLERPHSQIPMGCHHGQRKLLLSEIQFYNHYSREAQFVIYAGSAPCDHLPILLQRFPHLKFILIDPNYHTFLHDYKYIYQQSNVVDMSHWQFILKQSKNPNRRQHVQRLFKATMLFGEGKGAVNMLTAAREKTNPGLSDWRRLYRTSVTKMITDKSRVFVIQDYMTPELASSLKLALDAARVSHLFVSDIRTTMYGGYPKDLDYLMNDALQMIFIKTLQPLRAMIKFHPPYFNLDDTSVKEHGADHAAIWTTMKSYGIDVLENYEAKRYVYFQPEIINLQAWAPVSSSEARLIVGPLQYSQYQEYSHDAWDRQFMLFKSIRNYAHFPLYQHVRAIGDVFYDGCLDCNLEIAILAENILKLDQGVSIMDMDAIEQELQKPGIAQAVLKYKTEIDTVVGQKIIQCPTHGSLLYPPQYLIFHQLVKDPKRPDAWLWRQWSTVGEQPMTYIPVAYIPITLKPGAPAIEVLNGQDQDTFSELTRFKLAMDLPSLKISDDPVKLRAWLLESVSSD